MTATVKVVVTLPVAVRPYVEDGVPQCNPVCPSLKKECLADGTMLYACMQDSKVRYHWLRPGREVGG